MPPANADKAEILLPQHPCAKPPGNVVLFAFDEVAFPFRKGVAHHLVPGNNPVMALPAGPEGAPDEVLLYYGTVIRIQDKFHMWYYGSHGPPGAHIGYGHGRARKENGTFTNCLCYATSDDGVRWEKPELGLVDFRGSTHNNLVNLPEPSPRPAAVVFHDPEDPDPNRRFKLAYEAEREGAVTFCVAFSPDGLNWQLSEKNPVAGFFEMAGGVRWNGLYYVTGQAGLRENSALPIRTLDTFVSSDFEHWSPCAATGLNRAWDLSGPATEGDIHQFEEIHLGAGLWNRGNVILGIYGQWHGHPSGDRRLLTMDLGLAISHDAIHYREPIPGFRFIPAREQPHSPPDFPALMQGQGMENVGDRTLYWYSLWRGTEGTGVRLVSWERDRLGYLQPVRGGGGRVLSCPFEVVSDEADVFLNVSGLGEYCTLRASLVDEGFRPLPGYSGAGAVRVSENGLKVRLRWPTDQRLDNDLVRMRLDIQFEGIRAEDARLHTAYVENQR